MNNTNFDQAAWEAFQEAAAEKYDFSTCMRPDGSKYGSRGRCIKGSETSPASKDDKKSGSKSSSGGGGGAAEQLRQINAQEGRGGGVGKNGRSPVGKTGVISDKEKAAMSKGGGGASSKDVKALDKKAKEADKKADAADKKFQKSKSPADAKEAKRLDKEAKTANNAADKADKAFQSSQKIQAKTKKLSAEYEKLRGDTSPKATARRKQIMEDVNKNIGKQKELQKTIDKAGATPKKPDTSLPAQQRRSSAAARARD